MRLKLALAFAAAMGLLLLGLGLFIYARFQAGLDQSLNQSLRSRTHDVRALVQQADTGLADAGKGAGAGSGFAQVLGPGAKVLDQTPGLGRRPLLDAREVTRSGRGSILVTRRLGGGAGQVRLLATPVRAQDKSLIVIVGVSLQSRTSALKDLRAVMLLGGPVALLLASLLGYGVSALSLRSVEAMRRRTTQLSLTEPGQRLPVPPARDELQRLALTLNEMLARNEAAFARERRFVADASHELRSPLTVLKTELEVALTGDSSQDELRAALVSADGEADRVAHLARDLLTLAQADEDELPIEPTRMDVRVTFERVRQRFGERARASGQMVVISVAVETTVRADPLRIEQALSNLLDNALRHGAGTVVLFADRRGGAIELHVADSGPGFSESFLTVAFERFSRPVLGRTVEGTGLGLSIVRSIARAHGGEAHATNRVSGGADTWISLPEGSDGPPWRALSPAAHAEGP